MNSFIRTRFLLPDHRHRLPLSSREKGYVELHEILAKQILLSFSFTWLASNKLVWVREVFLAHHVRRREVFLVYHMWVGKRSWPPYDGRKALMVHQMRERVFGPPVRWELFAHQWGRGDVLGWPYGSRSSWPTRCIKWRHSTRHRNNRKDGQPVMGHHLRNKKNWWVLITNEK